MLFVVTIVNDADRATLAIAGPVLSRNLGLNAVQMGFIFSAFGWSYVLGPLPDGWLLDKFGSKIVELVEFADGDAEDVGRAGSAHQVDEAISHHLLFLASHSLRWR